MKTFVLVSGVVFFQSCESLHLSQSRFCGRPVIHNSPSCQLSQLTMRKQKASDKRTRRSQRGQVLESPLVSSSDLRSVGKAWNYKSLDIPSPTNVGYSGRGRSRKRSQVYNNLSSYHSHFLDLITEEFLSEVSQSTFLAS
jgi:hypothetical protein